MEIITIAFIAVKSGVSELT
uniref:Uncharacterized protein n=1 Tax=Anguilla anguilla TaxID=7936 RepID=A0A0E9VWB8_ANGAN